MLYSSAGILALIIHLIINHDILLKTSSRDIVPAYDQYRGYLFNVMVYYITDILWGLLYERGMITAVFIDTAVYFYAMATTVYMWTRYVVAYLKEDRFFGRALKSSGLLFFIYEVIMIVVNFFFPILYSFDEAGVYHAQSARFVTLGIQVIMFFMTSVFAFLSSFKQEGNMKFRHLTIAVHSLAMVGFVIAQVNFPLLPLYAIGCMLGGCLLHSFVLENEKEEHHTTLEETLREGALEGNYYDTLTGLQGTAHFFKEAHDKRAKELSEGGHPVFLYCDVNGMKYYNERNSFAVGDKLLLSLARLLADRFGDGHCSRLGSDKFVVYCVEEGLEDKLKDVFKKWEELNGDDCPAIRVGIYPDRKGDIMIGAACDRAKMARDTIYNSYVSAYKFFDEKLREDAEMQQYVNSHLDEAIRDEHIDIYFQPIVRATNGRVCDEEALARWNDPEKGMLTPDKFIPALEKANLIYKLDLYMVEKVLKKLQKQKEAGLYLVPQSVNLSRADFDSCDMVEEIRKRVDEAGVPHDLISIEITESIIGSDFDFIKTQVERFRALGFPVWLDDFGSGYSSMDVLQSMTFDLIKFDMRFMQQFDKSKNNRVILSELVRMTDALGIDTICEGVETEEQVEFLREIGCAKLQGYYYARPMPLEKILERYATGTQIGFENPEESSYFNAIDRINLHDLTVVTQEEEEELRNYFDTVPMAIIEVRGNKARFTRTNKAYREFMLRTFNFDLSGLSGTSFEETPEGPGMPFVIMLRQCCNKGGRAVFDEKMPDGMVVHSFMRRIACNPLTETIAAAVAVLAISDETSL